jgi:hypothetical protein
VMGGIALQQHDDRVVGFLQHRQGRPRIIRLVPIRTRAELQRPLMGFSSAARYSGLAST